MPYSVSKSAWRPHVRAAVIEINDRFTPSSVGTYPGHSPTMSLAADFMCNKSDGDAIADYARANAKRLGIQYVIWYRRIWNVQRDGEGWRHYQGKDSSPSAQHTNHVHISWKPTPGTGGPVVNSLIGNDNGQVDLGDLPGVQTLQTATEVYAFIKKTTDWATNRQNWINVLLVLIGSFLVLLALWRLAGTEALKTVKAAVS